MYSVYPRWRGEHRKPTVSRLPCHGLSPLARGTHCASNTGANGNRFIPAGAGNTLTVVLEPLMISVYPRWRGEHKRSKSSFKCIDGLSPLARGTHFCQTFVCYLSRFIPAGAGNTHLAAWVQRLLTVYPRWRGEHNFLHDWITVRTGLSPLARGTQIKTNILLVRRRFIPAGAGNTDRPGTFSAAPAVYPRWRGEHF